ncbi:MAG: hypothetical protein ACFFD1_14615, partial [Candidatus Thorarchaeota archaeon]
YRFQSFNDLLFVNKKQYTLKLHNNASDIYYFPIYPIKKNLHLIYETILLFQIKLYRCGVKKGLLKK